MGDILIQAAVKPVAEQVASSGSPAQIPEANSGDVSRFRDAMAGGEPEKIASAGSPELPVADLQNAAPSASLPTGSSSSLGDSILNGMGKLRSAQDASIQQINQLVEGAKDAPLTMQQTIELQFRLAQLSMHQDLTAKVADKGSQGVQNLMKNQ